MTNIIKLFKGSLINLIFVFSFILISPAIEQTPIALAESCQCLCGDEGTLEGCQPTPNDCQTTCDNESGTSNTKSVCNESCSGDVSQDDKKSGPPTATGTSSRASATLTLTNPLGGARDINVIIGRIAKAMITLAGALALLAFIWGGIQMMASGGVAAKHEKGKQTLIWATVGLVLIFTAYTLVNTVISVLTSGSV